MSNPRARLAKKKKNPNFGLHPSKRTDRILIDGKYKKK